MYKLQNKLLIFFGLVAVLPILIIGILSYVVTNNSTNEKYSTESKSLLMQISLNITNKTDRINKTLEYLKNDITIQNALTNVNFINQNYEALQAKKNVNDIVFRSLMTESDVTGVVFLTENGGYFSYNSYVNDAFELMNSDMIKKIKSEKGKIVWVDKSIVPNDYFDRESKIIVACSIKDSKNLLSDRDIGIILFEVKSGIFDDVIGNIKTPKNDSFIVVGEDNTKLAGKNDADFSEEFYSVLNSKSNIKISDLVKLNSNGKKYMVNYVSVPEHYWVIAQTIPYRDYFRAVGLIGFATVLVCLFYILTISILAYHLSKSITSPIKQLYNSMQAVSNGRFDVLVNVKTKDEIGDICEDYNKLVATTENLFKASVEKERQLNDIKIRMLRYQINPHFLYNTLTTIGLVVKSGRIDDGYKLVKVLSRLLKNTLSHTDKFITIALEIENLKDYIYIQQVWCGNKINVDYKLEDNVLEQKIPCMLLQPIVENAINHGLHQRINNKGDAKLEISVHEDSEFVEICVFDNGLGISDDKIKSIFQRNEIPNNHIGLFNIFERIKLQCGGKSEILIDSKNEEFTKIIIRLQKF